MKGKNLVDFIKRWLNAFADRYVTKSLLMTLIRPAPPVRLIIKAR